MFSKSDFEISMQRRKDLQEVISYIIMGDYDAFVLKMTSTHVQTGATVLRIPVEKYPKLLLIAIKNNREEMVSFFTSNMSRNYLSILKEFQWNDMSDDIWPPVVQLFLQEAFEKKSLSSLIIIFNFLAEKKELSLYIKARVLLGLEKNLPFLVYFRTHKILTEYFIPDASCINKDLFIASNYQKASQKEKANFLYHADSTIALRIYQYYENQIQTLFTTLQTKYNAEKGIAFDTGIARDLAKIIPSIATILHSLRPISSKIKRISTSLLILLKYASLKSMMEDFYVNIGASSYSKKEGVILGELFFVNECILLHNTHDPCLDFDSIAVPSPFNPALPTNDEYSLLQFILQNITPYSIEKAITAAGKAYGLHNKIKFEQRKKGLLSNVNTQNANIFQNIYSFLTTKDRNNSINANSLKILFLRELMNEYPDACNIYPEAGVLLMHAVQITEELFVDSDSCFISWHKEAGVEQSFEDTPSCSL